jgi:hypothetical protein
MIVSVQFYDHDLISFVCVLRETMRTQKAVTKQTESILKGLSFSTSHGDHCIGGAFPRSAHSSKEDNDARGRHEPEDPSTRRKPALRPGQIQFHLLRVNTPAAMLEAVGENQKRRQKASDRG